MSEVRLDTLRPGAAFKDEFGEYRLLYLNLSRARIQPLEKKHRTIEKRFSDITGEPPLAEFEQPGGAFNVAPSMMVHPIAVAESFDDILGTSTKPAAAVRSQRGQGKLPHPPKRPCDRTTKRGKVLLALIAKKKINEVAAEFGMNRSAVLTYCYEIWRDHGVGYEVSGDVVTLNIEQDPFDLRQPDTRVEVPSITTDSTTDYDDILGISNSKGAKDHAIRTEDRRKENVPGNDRRDTGKAAKEQIRKKPAARLDKRKPQHGSKGRGEGRHRGR